MTDEAEYDPANVTWTTVSGNNPVAVYTYDGALADERLAILGAISEALELLDADSVAEARAVLRRTLDSHDF